MTIDGFDIYDTTLRDGSQQEGLTLSVADKLAIARHLDDLGVTYIEGGWPGAVPKDTEFFRRAATELHLRQSLLAGFGATRSPGGRAADDPMLGALRDSGVRAATIVAKSHDRHVHLALRTTPAENLAMIRDTVAHLTAEGIAVFLAAEHFFDAYQANASFALDCVLTAADAGAEVVVLCDTNGGMLPDQITEMVSAVAARTSARLGIHCHDDTGCAVANSLAAVAAGVTHVQGTANGYGERTGNANLFSVIAALELKRHRPVLPPGAIEHLTGTAHAIGAVTGIPPAPRQPYVGSNAFAHKAGLHTSAMKADPALYQHIDPAAVGNGTRILISEMAGRSSVEMKVKELGRPMPDPDTVGRIVARVKELEAEGHSFESADASFELLLHEFTAGRLPLRVRAWQYTLTSGDGAVATVDVALGEGEACVTAPGGSPTAALEAALQQAVRQVQPRFPTLTAVSRRQYALAGGLRSRAQVEVTDGVRTWTTTNVGEDPITASWRAVQDAVNYALITAP
ncbi:2-isopropylmalate synthase [Allocatelliglobosispora scoriae]|uniref:Citramalate synthase n=1 Tax=Allocatelliglobosispora scoriae TaxID=643052 RepID=A0A841BI41_9ACTN|nr:2-isopropylmalate synthase [Allocatelliglobosispora scoriae]